MREGVGDYRGICVSRKRLQLLPHFYLETIHLLPDCLFLSPTYTVHCEQRRQVAGVAGQSGLRLVRALALSPSTSRPRKDGAREVQEATSERVAQHIRTHTQDRVCLSMGKMLTFSQTNNMQTGKRREHKTKQAKVSPVLFFWLTQRGPRMFFPGIVK